MLLFLAQTLACVAATLVLIRFILTASPAAGPLRTIALLGIAVRAVLGQVLFWVSYLELPLWRELQGAPGFWFFGLDGEAYFAQASAAADQGLFAILQLERQYHSALYVKVLAGTLWTFGSVPSAALLLNLFSHAGIVAHLVRWTRVEPVTARSAAVAITAISVSPAFVLWSLQPLKDTPFQFLIVAFITACAAWQAAWRGAASWPVRIGIGFLLVVAGAALSALRWYVGLAALAAAVVFLLVVAAQSHGRRRVAFAAAFGVLALLTMTVLWPGRVGSLLVAGVLTSRTAPDLQSLLANEFANARNATDALGGSTAMTDNRAPIRSQRPASTPPPIVDATGGAPITPSATAEHAVQGNAIRSLLQHFVGAWTARDVAGMLRALDDSDGVEFRFVPNGPVRRGHASIAKEFRRLAAQPRGPGTLYVLDSTMLIVRDTARATARFTTPGAGAGASGRIEFVAVRRAEGWKLLEVMVMPHAIAPDPTELVRAENFVSGIAAMLLPRFVGESLGLFAVSGGRGFIWVADLDTLLFGFVLAFAIVAFLRARGAWMRNPTFWLVAILTVSVAVPISYAMTNFGGLFRLRGTVYLCVMLAPLTMARAQPASED